jgi:hypothetical protein
MEDRHKLVQILRSELSFLEQGGYRRRRRFPWRPNFAFEDSPTCINFADTGERRPCTQCPLIQFVPSDRRESRVPCRHINLTERGDTINSFYEWGTDEELESALRGWLGQTIQELESGVKVNHQEAYAQV